MKKIILPLTDNEKAKYLIVVVLFRGSESKKYLISSFEFRVLRRNKMSDMKRARSSANIARHRELELAKLNSTWNLETTVQSVDSRERNESLRSNEEKQSESKSKFRICFIVFFIQ